MGAKLVGYVFVICANVKLKPNERDLLTWMAHTALDDDKPPRYFAAREQSAFGLGRIVPDQPALDDPQRAAKEAERNAAFQAVKTATQGLVKAGLIVRTRRGREGQRAEYTLPLAELAERVRGTKSLPLESRESLPLSGKESLPQQVGNPYPQGTTKEPPGETPGERSPQATISLPPVDNSDLERSAA